MLYRRVLQNVKDQNWVAVGIDFLIVVVGVFIGIQVANWNDTQQSRRDELVILERLSDETRMLLETARQERAELETHATLISSILPVLYSSAPMRDLTSQECQAISGSHIYRRSSDELPVLNELLATGRFNLLTDEPLKQELRAYILFRDRQRADHEERINELYRLHVRHPGTIKLAPVPNDQDTANDWRWQVAGYRWDATCNISNMRSNQQFLNELFDNTARSTSLLNSHHTRERILIELSDRLKGLLADHV